jgi:hypothetical protein
MKVGESERGSVACVLPPQLSCRRLLNPRMTTERFVRTFIGTSRGLSNIYFLGTSLTTLSGSLGPGTYWVQVVAFNDNGNSAPADAVFTVGTGPGADVSVEHVRPLRTGADEQPVVSRSGNAKP